jgi:hypothetical protein
MLYLLSTRAREGPTYFPIQFLFHWLLWLFRLSPWSSAVPYKTAKYLRSVLSELGFHQQTATPLYCDNVAAIHMVNHSIPTKRTRHVDIQHFAIQEWARKGDITLLHIPGVINPSDSATKATTWILHSRHVRRAMGHHGVP